MTFVVHSDQLLVTSFLRSVTLIEDLLLYLPVYLSDHKNIAFNFWPTQDTVSTGINIDQIKLNNY